MIFAWAISNRIQRTTPCFESKIKVQTLLELMGERCCLLHKLKVTWEEIIAILVEADRHDSVSQEECFFDTIAMMHIDIDINHARVVLEQFKRTEHNVVHIAESTCFLLLRVVKSTAPIDSNIRLLVDDHRRAIKRTTCTDLAEIVKAFEARAIWCITNSIYIFDPYSKR